MAFFFVVFAWLHVGLPCWPGERSCASRFEICCRLRGGQFTGSTLQRGLMTPSGARAARVELELGQRSLLVCQYR